MTTAGSALVVKKKKLFRLYREVKLAVSRRGGRKRAIPLRPDERWSLDFVSHQLTDGRRFRYPSMPPRE